MSISHHLLHHSLIWLSWMRTEGVWRKTMRLMKNFGVPVTHVTKIRNFFTNGDVLYRYIVDLFLDLFVTGSRPFHWIICFKKLFQHPRGLHPPRTGVPPPGPGLRPVRQGQQAFAPDTATIDSTATPPSSLSSGIQSGSMWWPRGQRGTDDGLMVSWP